MGCLSVDFGLRGGANAPGPFCMIFVCFALGRGDEEMCAARPPFGSPAASFAWEARWLCVPASRRVCPYRGTLTNSTYKTVHDFGPRRKRGHMVCVARHAAPGGNAGDRETPPAKTNFLEPPTTEVRRTPLLRGWVNRGKRKGETGSPFTDTRGWLAAPYDPESQKTLTRNGHPAYKLIVLVIYTSNRIGR